MRARFNFLRFFTTFLLMPSLALWLLSSCGMAMKRADAAGSRGYYAKPKASKRSVSATRSRGRTEIADKGVSAARKRLVIYSGELRVATPDVDGAADKVRAVTEALGGKVQSTNRSRYRRTARIVVRVPVARFYEAVEKLGALGRVTSRRINARDVTREFQDTAQRLASARRTRERLYALMKAQADVEERIKILREINRLTSRIEGITARLKYLKNRASMSTIVVLLSGRGAENLASFGASPFNWIRSLHPARRGINGVRSFKMDKPKGFFDFRDTFLKGRSAHAFASPDGARIRVGVLENYPRGDLKFWARAGELELNRRGYAVSRSNAAGKTPGVVFQCKAQDGFAVIYYSVRLLVDDDHIQILETVYPSEASRKKHGAAVRKALSSYSLRTDLFTRFLRLVRLAP